jgi:hypothetical protein
MSQRPTHSMSDESGRAFRKLTSYHQQRTTASVVRSEGREEDSRFLRFARND